MNSYTCRLRVMRRLIYGLGNLNNLLGGKQWYFFITMQITFVYKVIYSYSLFFRFLCKYASTWIYSKQDKNREECPRQRLKGTGSQFSASSLIKLLFSNLSLILLTYISAISDLRVYFKVEVYFKVTWSGMEEY